MAKLSINYMDDADNIANISVEAGGIANMTDAQAVAVAEALAIDPVLGQGFEARNVRIDTIYIVDLFRTVNVPRRCA